MTDPIKVEDIPESLPPHPEERRLRKGERELAATIRELAGKVCAALENDDPDKTKARIEAAIALQLLKDTADAGRAAEARAIDDQMKLLNPS